MEEFFPIIIPLDPEFMVEDNNVRSAKLYPQTQYMVTNTQRIVGKIDTRVSLGGTKV